MPSKNNIISTLLMVLYVVNAEFFEGRKDDLYSREVYDDHLHVRDLLGLHPRKYYGAHDAAQKIKDGIQGGVNSVKNSKSPGGHNPIPPALGGAVGAIEGVGAILSPTSGRSRPSPPKTPLQLKEGKTRAEQELANKKNAKDTAYQFGETAKKGFNFAGKLGKLEGDAFAASGKIQDKLLGNKPGSPAAKLEATKKSKRDPGANVLYARALYARALIEDFQARNADALMSDNFDDFETRDFKDLYARNLDFDDWL